MKKRFALAVIVITAIALSLVGCGVKVTNISVPDAATLEKGESITLPVNFGKNGDGAVVLTTCTVLFL